MRDLVRKAKAVDHRLGASLTNREKNEVRRCIERIAPDLVLFNSLFQHTELSNASIATGILAHDLVHERAAALHSAGFKTTPAILRVTTSERFWTKRTSS